MRNDFICLVNKIFDKMQRLKHFKFTNSHTLFSFLVFMVWKITSNKEKKSRKMINIRKFNELIIPSAYLLPLQLKIIINVQKCINLVVLDAVSFFYQYLLYLNYQFIFIVVTHRQQKTFQVIIMSYINLVAYV